MLKNVFLKLFKLILKKDCILHCCPKSLNIRQIIFQNKIKNLWFDISNWVKMTNDFHQKSSCLTEKDNDNHHLTKDEQKKVLFILLTQLLHLGRLWFFFLNEKGLILNLNYLLNPRRNWSECFILFGMNRKLNWF